MKRFFFFAATTVRELVSKRMQFLVQKSSFANKAGCFSVLRPLFIIQIRLKTKMAKLIRLSRSHWNIFRRGIRNNYHEERLENSFLSTKINFAGSLVQVQYVKLDEKVCNFNRCRDTIELLNFFSFHFVVDIKVSERVGFVQEKYIGQMYTNMQVMTEARTYTIFCKRSQHPKYLCKRFNLE